MLLEPLHVPIIICIALVLLQIPRDFPSNSPRLYTLVTSTVLCIVCITISIVSNPSAEDSLRTILDSISTLTSEWFKLGVALGLSYSTLKTIESNYRWLPRGRLECHRYQCYKLKTTDDLAGSMSLKKHPNDVWIPI